MSYILIPKGHYFFSIANEVSEICAPLFTQYGLNSFYYLRVFDDDTGYILMSHREYLDYHAQKDYPVSPPISDHILSNKFSFLGLPELSNDPFNAAYESARNLFGLDYSFYMVERYENYYEVCAMTAAPENHDIINFYINYLDVLENFKFYFLEKASKLIQEVVKYKVPIPSHLRPNFGGLRKASSTIDNYKAQFLNKVPLQRYVMSHLGEKIFFTKREVESLKLLHKGYTAKEMGKQMHLSCRTVETHLNNIKYKLGITKKSAIIETIAKFKLPPHLLV